MWRIVSYILATPPPQILHLLARFGKGIPEGAQLAADTTLVSPPTSAGQPRRRAGRYARAALHEARQAKERVYLELQGTRRCRLVVLAIEFGGRWSPEAAYFIRSLAHTKPRATPPHLRQATITTLMARWTVSLTHAAMHANAASLLSMPCEGAITREDAPPPLRELLAQHPEAAPAPSRLPGPWFDLSVWTFLLGFSSLDFAILDSGAMALGQQWETCSSKKVTVCMWFCRLLETSPAATWGRGFHRSYLKHINKNWKI